MKRFGFSTLLIAFTGLLVLALPGTSIAQKQAFIDSQYILNNIPEYTDAQDILNNLSEKWQKEIESKHLLVKQMYEKYQAEEVLLPNDVKKKRQDAIMKKNAEVQALQKKYFGPKGELFKKREALVKPIQEKVYNAIETVATTRNIDMVFDKAGSPTLLYGNPKFDISDLVLDEVGAVMQTSGQQPGN
jgi:outer membrane protein